MLGSIIFSGPHLVSLDGLRSSYVKLRNFIYLDLFIQLQQVGTLKILATVKLI